MTGRERILAALQCDRPDRVPVFEMYMNGSSIVGVHRLLTGEPDRMEASIRQTTNIAAPGGGYILTSSNAVHPSVNPENSIAMVQASHKYGGYA